MTSLATAGLVDQICLKMSRHNAADQRRRVNFICGWQLGPSVALAYSLGEDCMLFELSDDAFSVLFGPLSWDLRAGRCRLVWVDGRICLMV